MEKEKKGTAVAYNENRGVPEIIAQARGQFVEKLIQIAKDHDIVIHRDADLAESLSVLETGTEIPENLYIAMSEVLAYCYRVNTQFKEKIVRRFE